MTAATFTAPSSGKPRQHISQFERFARFTASSTGITLRDFFFIFFTAAMPVMLFLIISTTFGKEIPADVRKQAFATMMLNMAAYGGFGAAINSGYAIQAQRASGWFRQLIITGLSPLSIVTGKIITAAIVIIPDLLIIFAVGRWVKGVDLPFSSYTQALLLMWVCLLPMILLGLVIGLVFGAAAGNALTTIVLLVMSMVSGLWFPLQYFPDWLQLVGRACPTYWVVEMGKWGLLENQGAFPWRGVLIIGIWAVVLVGVASLGYRRSVQKSRRF